MNVIDLRSDIEQIMKDTEQDLDKIERDRKENYERRDVYQNLCIQAEYADYKNNPVEINALNEIFDAYNERCNNYSDYKNQYTSLLGHLREFIGFLSKLDPVNRITSNAYLIFEMQRKELYNSYLELYSSTQNSITRATVILTNLTKSPKSIT